MRTQGGMAVCTPGGSIPARTWVWGLQPPGLGTMPVFAEEVGAAWQPARQTGGGPEVRASCGPLVSTAGKGTLGRSRREAVPRKWDNRHLGVTLSSNKYLLSAF